MMGWDNLINPGTVVIFCSIIFGYLCILLGKYVNITSDGSEPIVKESKPNKKKYRIYDLHNQDDRKLFANSLMQDTFALIKINDEYKSSFCDLFHIFDKLFSSNEALQCEIHEKYIGYTSTKNVKQSLWFHLDYNQKTLFPSLKNKQSLLYKYNNQEKVMNAFNNYNEIANTAMSAFLENQCRDKKSYMECWNNLFPKNQIIEEKNNDMHETKHNNDTYPECNIYHKYRKSHNLSLNNIAAIQYYGDGNKELEFNCEEHMDYTLITLVTANEPGLQVRDLMYFEWIDVDDIIKSNNMQIKDVIIVMTGLTGGTLLNDTVPCYHAVKKQRYKTHRISFPLFCYADPNGIIDSTLIKSNIDSKTNSTQSDHKKIDCAPYLSQNMYNADVNF